MKRICSNETLINSIAHILPQVTISQNISKIYSINLKKFKAKYSNFKHDLVPYSNIGAHYKVGDLIEMYRIKYIESKRNFLSFNSSTFEHFFKDNFGYNSTLHVFINFFDSSF